MGMVSASLSLSEWESTIGGQLGSMFGSGTVCLPPGSGNCIDLASLLITVFVLGFFFIWTSVSGIAWDGVFILLMMVLAVTSTSGTFGTVGWTLFSFITAIVMIGFLYRGILRRG
jgi:hypothetical protein